MPPKVLEYSPSITVIIVALSSGVVHRTVNFIWYYGRYKRHLISGFLRCWFIEQNDVT